LLHHLFEIIHLAWIRLYPLLEERGRWL